MPLPFSPNEIPSRPGAGAHSLHAGLGKWSGGEARQVNALAAGALPFVESVGPQVFAEALPGGEPAPHAPCVGGTA